MYALSRPANEFLKIQTKISFLFDWFFKVIVPSGFVFVNHLTEMGFSLSNGFVDSFSLLNIDVPWDAISCSSE